MVSTTHDPFILVGGLVAMNVIFPLILGIIIPIIPNWRTHIFQRGGPTTNQYSTGDGSPHYYTLLVSFALGDLRVREVQLTGSPHPDLPKLVSKWIAPMPRMAFLNEGMRSDSGLNCVMICDAPGVSIKWGYSNIDGWFHWQSHLRPAIT